MTVCALLLKGPDVWVDDDDDKKNPDGQIYGFEDHQKGKRQNNNNKQQQQKKKGREAISIDPLIPAHGQDMKEESKDISCRQGMSRQ